MDEVNYTIVDIISAQNSLTVTRKSAFCYFWLMVFAADKLVDVVLLREKKHCSIVDKSGR
jgi:hypothetical protein